MGVCGNFSVRFGVSIEFVVFRVGFRDSSLRG